MGFAQKLGEFAGGFSEGLLPGIQVGTDIAESKSRRAAANTREQRLESGAQKAMLYKMFEYDPAGAMAKAESLGLSDLATSFRRKTKGDIGKSFASAGAKMSDVPATPRITSLTTEGLQRQVDALKSTVDTRTAAAGNVDVTLAGVPEGMEGLVDSDPLLAQRRAFNTQTDVIRSNLTASETFLANISRINYNKEDYSTNIDEATNAYIQATGNSEAGNALKSELLKSARESQRATWMPVIDSLKGDAEGLNDLLANRIILESPILSTTVASLIRKAERDQDLSPEQKRIRDEAQASADLLEGMAKNTAITNPVVAAEYYAQSLDIRTKNQLENPETLSVLAKNAEEFLNAATQRSRQEIATSILSDITNSYTPEAVLSRYARLFNIDIPADIKINTEKGQRAFSNLVDAIQGSTLQTQEPEAKTDATPVGAMLDLLNSGELDIAIKSMNEFAGDPTAPELIRALRANGWEWIPLPVPGQFTKIEERRDTQPEPVQQPAATDTLTSPVQQPEQNGQQLPFLPGQ